MKCIRVVFFLFCFISISYAQQPRLVLPIGHTEYISKVSFSPSGKYILSESNGQIMLWETKSGRLLQSISGEFTSGFSKDESTIITHHKKPDFSSYIQFSDLLSGKILDTIEGYFIDFNADKSLALITSDDGTVTYWDTINKKIIFKLKAELGTLILDDNYILTAISLDKDSNINQFDVFEISTQKKVKSYQGVLSGVSKKFICLKEDSVLRVYNLKTGDTLQTISLPENEYYKGQYLHYETKFTDDEKYMIGYEKDHSYSAVLFDTDFQTSKAFTFKKDIGDIVFNPDGKSFIATSTFMDSTATAIDIISNDTLFCLKGHKKNITDLKFSPDKKYILTASADATVILWDAYNGSKIRTFEGINAMPVGSVISPNQKYLSYFVNNQLFVFEIPSFRRVLSLPFPQTDISFTSDSRYIILCRSLFSNEGRPLLKKIDILTGETICSFAYEQDNSSEYIFNKNGLLIGANPNNDKDAFVIYTDKKEKIVSIKSIEGSQLERVQFSSDNEYCIFLFCKNRGKENSISTMICYSVADWKINWEYTNHFIFDDFEINEKKKEIVFRTGISDDSVNLLHLKDGTLINSNDSKPINGENYTYQQAIFFSPNGSVFSVLDHNKIRFYEFKTGKLILKHENEEHIVFVHYFDEKKVLIGYMNKPVEFWDLEAKRKTGYKKIDGRIIAFYGSNYIVSDSYYLNIYDKNFHKLCSLMNFGTDDYINLIDGGYYQSTQNASKKLYYVTNQLKTIGFEQLDVKYNRPDKVLKAIGNTDKDLIKAYHKAYEKRIRKLGIDTLAFREGYSVPESEFVNRDVIAYEQKNEKLVLHIKGSDDTYKLDRYNVWVNEVPVFGMRGKSIREKNTNSIDTTLTITLSDGENRIETSITNVNATESYRMPLTVNYVPAVKQKETTHFIGIGIDKFADNRYNLNYSAKDIRDLVVKLKEKYREEIVIDTLFNENVTIANIKALKQKLLQTKENDKVIVAYSGHGLLSKDYDYYLSTYAINFERPEDKGLAYDELENLLDDIPARKKLLLLDACHSGEVDKEELDKIKNLASEGSITAGAKGSVPIATADSGKIGMKNSFELMQELFVNVGRSTGTTVISAAGGTQFALEKGDLKNGVFTYSILDFMEKKPEATISELKGYVNKRVPELTKGLQVPTTRTETNVVDWRIW